MHIKHWILIVAVVLVLIKLSNQAPLNQYLS